MLAAVALALAAAGCMGGDESDTERGASRTDAPAGGTPPRTNATPAERRAIRAAVVRLFKSNDLRVVCEGSLTPRLFRQIFRGRDGCRKAVADEEEDDEPVKRVEVSGIEVRGSRASAHARIVGGESPGARGAVSLRKAMGEWRADDLSTAFLRSSVKASLLSDEDIPRAVARCVSGRLVRMPDDRFKRFAYSLLGQKPPATARLLRTLSTCDRPRGGVSTIRRPVERALVKELREAGVDRRAFDCVLRRLRSTLPDELLVELSAKDDRASKTRITREVVAAAIACGAGPKRPPRELSPA